MVTVMVAVMFSIIAGLIHVYIFFMESIWWGQDKVNKAFGVSLEHAEIMRSFAYNQGWYNLFIGCMALAGAGLCLSGQDTRYSNTMMGCACFVMVGAGIVLFFSTGKLKPAIMQAVPPFISLVAILFSLQGVVK